MCSSDLPREAAFYHVQRATAFTGSSPSSQPVNWFWNVSRGDTDLTANARGGRTAGVSFGGAGEAVNIVHRLFAVKVFFEGVLWERPANFSQKISTGTVLHSIRIFCNWCLQH